MPAKSTPPSIRETAFDCPHCGAYTTQEWLELFAKNLIHEGRTPLIPDEDFSERVRKIEGQPDEVKAEWIDWHENMRIGLVFIRNVKQAQYSHSQISNLFLSHCYNCKKFAVWIHDRLVSPTAIASPPANLDLPPDVLRDYEEAGRIVTESPRGAAALLRLTIQKLCAFLGEKGKNIDEDIASLVKKGLNPMVQQALDGVRVIGNEAVHPGTIDLKDDRDTAIKLFKSVNIIAEQMISNPKHVQELYGKIPENKLKGIERRDGASS